ncbi:MAG: TIGR01777 family protein [Gemmatimonadaceae bacterium]|nr:TIGR01777 family protein [Gemmatimonadaceae bacterium]
MQKAARVALTGANGMVGSALTTFLTGKGITVVRIVRESSRATNNDIVWNPSAGTLDASALEGLDSVIHLAGEPIAERWSETKKAAIRQSRVDGTSLLAKRLAELASPPRVLVSASAMGIYGDRGDEILTEESAPGRDFLASVVREWESAADSARTAGIRVAHPRFGIILSASGGALAKMLPPFKLGAGGKLGPGSQWWSWIAMQDVLSGIALLLENEELDGPINFVSPNPVRNAEFTDTLGHVLSRPTVASVPAFALRLLFGEMADATLLASQRVAPKRLEAAGFRFEYPVLEKALRVAVE